MAEAKVNWPSIDDQVAAVAAAVEDAEYAVETAAGESYRAGCVENLDALRTAVATLRDVASRKSFSSLDEAALAVAGDVMDMIEMAKGSPDEWPAPRLKAAIQVRVTTALSCRARPAPQSFHPAVLRAHEQFGGDLADMQRRYDAAPTP